MRRLLFRGLALTLAMAGVCGLILAGSVHVKAAVAQVLLERCWASVQTTGVTNSPWSWADIRLAARLQIDERHRFLVFDNDSGEALAFGPGMSAGVSQWTVKPRRWSRDAGEVTVISAHRDTHFAVLEEAGVGDEWLLEGANGRRQRYRVRTMRVVHSRDRIGMPVLTPGDLLLVTCYPFDAITPGGPLRFLVHAVPVSPQPQDGHVARLD